MATTDLRNSGATNYPALPKGGTILLEKKIDYSTYNAVDNDIFQLFSIKAGTLIVAASIYVKTGEGSTATLDLGVSTAGTTDATFMDDASIETGSVWLVGDGSDGDAPGTVVNYLVLADTIVVIDNNNTCDDAEIHVKILVSDMTGALGLTLVEDA